MPALQYIDVVDEGSAAEEAELKPGDFIVGINAESVVNASHEYTVKQIKKSGACVTIEILRPMEETPPPPPPPPPPPMPILPFPMGEGGGVSQPHYLLQQRLSMQEQSDQPSPMQGSMTLPSRARHSYADTSSSSNTDGGSTGLPRRPSTSSTSTSNGSGIDGGSIGGMAKFASIKGRHRLSSQRISATELEAIIARHGAPKGDVTSASASNQAKPVVLVPPFRGGPGTRSVARTSISEENDEDTKGEEEEEKGEKEMEEEQEEKILAKDANREEEEEEEKVRGEGDGSEAGNTISEDVEKNNSAKSGVAKDETDVNDEVFEGKERLDETKKADNQAPLHGEQENNSISNGSDNIAKSHDLGEKNLVSNGVETVSAKEPKPATMTNVEKSVVDVKQDTAIEKASSPAPATSAEQSEAITAVEKIPSKPATRLAEFDVAAYEAATRAVGGTLRDIDRERLSRLNPRAVVAKNPPNRMAQSPAVAEIIAQRVNNSSTPSPPPPPPPPPSTTAGLPTTMASDNETLPPPPSSPPLPPPPPPFRSLSQEEKMREFERRMASMKMETTGAEVDGSANAANYLMKAGQTGTLPAQFRHAAVVRPVGKQLQQPPQQQVRRSSLTSQTDVRQPPLSDGLAYYGPNVKNISAFGTLSAAQSQHMRQALSQRLNNQNNPSINGSTSNNNPRLNMRVMSPPVAGSRVVIAGKPQEALNGHQRSKSVPRKAPSELLSYDNYGGNVASPQMVPQQQQAQLIAHPVSLYGSPGRQEPVDLYHYQPGPFSYDLNGYPAPGVNYAVVYDNPYASLARPTSATRYAAPVAPNYGTLPTKGAVAQQQWRRHSELMYQQAAAYPVPIVYDAATGAYYAADATNPQLRARGIPIWSENDQTYVAADVGMPAYAHPNSVSYIVEPVVKTKVPIAQQQRVPSRQVFIPEPDYPGAPADALVNGSGDSSSAQTEAEKRRPQQRQPQPGLQQQPQQQNGIKKKTVTFAPFVTESSPEGTQTEKYSKLPFQNNAEFIELDSIQL